MKIISVLALVVSQLFFSTLYAAQAPAGQPTTPIVTTYESVCVQNLRTLNVAQVAYWGGDPKKGFARTIEALGPKGEDLIEPVLASGEKAGYRYVLTPTRVEEGVVVHYTITARPTKLLARGQKSYFTDDTGVIRFTEEDRLATVSDPMVK